MIDTIKSKSCFVYRWLKALRRWNLDQEAKRARRDYLRSIADLAYSHKREEVSRFVVAALPHHHIQGDPRRG